MTAQQLFQECQTHFPDLDFTRFLKKANDYQKVFAQETEAQTIIITGSTSRTGIDVLTPYTETLSYTPGGTTFFITFPSKALAITAIRFADDSYRYIDNPVTYNIENNRIEFFDQNGAYLQTFPSTATYVEFHCIKNPTDMSAASDSPDLPSQFHQAIVARVLTDLYATGKQALLQNAGWWRSEYDRIRRDARKYGLSNGDKTLHEGVMTDLLADARVLSTLTTDGDNDLDDVDGGAY